jgi:nucleoside-diphosphate-sugar epimerase
LVRQQLIPQPGFIPEVESLPDLAGREVAVTGASGVLGRVLIRRLAQLSITVHSFSDDIVDEESVEGWVAHTQPDLIFHLAAVVPTIEVEADPKRAAKVNAIGTLNLATAVAHHKPDAWLFLASTGHVYSATTARRALTESARLGGSSVYGATKLAAELVARPVLTKAGVPHSVGRIFSLAHHSQRPPYLAPTLLDQIDRTADGTVCPLRNPGAVRDFLDAETVVDVMLLLAGARASGPINIGSGTPTSVLEFATHLARLRRRSVSFVPDVDEDHSFLVADVTLLRRLVGIR